MFTSVAQANAAVIEQIRRARPHWLDVQTGFFTYQRTKRGQNTASRRAANALAGDDRTMKGACVGACLFEGWAKDEAQALAILEQGK